MLAMQICLVVGSSILLLLQASGIVMILTLFMRLGQILEALEKLTTALEAQSQAIVRLIQAHNTVVHNIEAVQAGVDMVMQVNMDYIENDRQILLGEVSHLGGELRTHQVVDDILGEDEEGLDAT